VRHSMIALIALSKAIDLQIMPSTLSDRHYYVLILVLGTS
jgi:hypothetical protein